MKHGGRALLRSLLASSVMPALLSLYLPSVSHAAPRALFLDVDVPGEAAQPQRRRFVRVDAELLASGEDVVLNLFDDVSALSAGTRVDERGEGLRSWSSHLEGERFGYALFTWRDDAVLGQVETDGAVFQIRPTGGLVHEIVEIDPSSFRPEAEPLYANVRAMPAESDAPVARGVARDAASSIRVLVAYTQAAAAASADIEAEAQLAVDAANAAYENSGMATRLDLVAAVETGYVENGDIYDDLEHLTSKVDGEMDELHALRNAYLADFVALLIEDSPDYCGLASLMTNVSPSFEVHAFSVTYRPCAVGNLTLAHELGHNMGCQHDRDNADSPPAYSWAYGFQDPEGDFRTVMAISGGCPAPCPRVAHFANPDVTYLGDPTGIDAAASDAAACALAIDATSLVTCDFRTLQPPGMLEASTAFTDRVEITFSHPWPWKFQVYRAESGGPKVALETTEASPFVDTTAAAGTSYDYWVSTLSLLDGESTTVGPVAGSLAVPVCGNAIPETPAEDCDDGNSETGDGCAPDCTYEIALDDNASDCVWAMNDRASRVAKAQGKESLTCLAAAASGGEPDADACLVADQRGKVAKARSKVESADLSLCAVPPDFCYTGATVASDAAEDERRSLTNDLFGADVSAAVLAKSVDAEGAGCQKAIAKALDRVAGAGVAAFLSCKKARLSSGELYASSSLETCFDEVQAHAANEGTKLGMAIAKLEGARLTKCAAVELGSAFPGACGSTIGASFDECLTWRAECRLCRFFNLADGLERDCDDFDDGVANSSCGF